MVSDRLTDLPVPRTRDEVPASSSKVMTMLQAADETTTLALRSDADHAPIEPGALRTRIVVVGAVLAAIGLGIVALPGLDEVRARLSGADPGWLAVMALLEAGSCAAFILAFRGIMCRRLPWRLSARMGMAVQSANVLVPTGGAGGLALAAWALARTGMSAHAIARRTVTLFVTTSAVNFVTAAAGGALLVLGVVSAEVALALSLGPAAAALLVIAAVTQIPRLLDRFGDRLGGRLAAATRHAVSEGLRDVGRLLRRRNAVALAGAAGYMLLDLAALTAAFEAVGAAPALGVLLVAYPLGQLGGLIPAPGGVGGTDGALIAVFVLYGSPLAVATAAVLAYRIFQLGIPAVLAGPAIGGTLRAVMRRSDAEAARRGHFGLAVGPGVATAEGVRRLCGDGAGVQASTVGSRAA